MISLTSRFRCKSLRPGIAITRCQKPFWHRWGFTVWQRLHWARHPGDPPEWRRKSTMWGKA